jgi:histidinol-phosphatase
VSFAQHPQFARTLALAGRLADVARRIARAHFRAPLGVERKADGSPVTEVDRGIEAAMRGMIRAEFPGHAIRGEEFGGEGDGGGGEFTWFLDPIDGTKSYVTGYPLFGSLIALARSGRPVLGVLEAPALGERWIGADGSPCTLNGAPARTSGCRTLAEATVLSTSPDLFDPGDRERYERVSARAALRRFGGDCYLYGLVAAGHGDLVIEARLKPHDFMALVPVVESAGGRMSDWRGAPLGPASDGRVVAAASEALWREAVDGLSAG